MKQIGAFLLITLAPLGVAILFIAAHFQWQSEPSTGAILRFAIGAEPRFFIYVLFYLSFFAGLVFLLVKQRTAIPGLFWTREIRIRKVIASAAAAYVALWLIALVTHQAGYSSAEYARTIMAQESVILRNAMLINAALVAPLAEECFFRGFVQPRLIEKFGARAGIVLQAVVFALAHLTFNGAFLAYLGFGIVLGMSFRYSGSLFSPLIVHVLNNSASMYLFAISTLDN